MQGATRDGSIPEAVDFRRVPSAFSPRGGSFRIACPTCGSAVEGGDGLIPASSTPAFDFQKILGRGGMGVVYLVKDRRLHRLVALKLLRNMGPEVAQALEREARLLAALEHECIVSPSTNSGPPATTPTC